MKSLILYPRVLTIYKIFLLTILMLFLTISCGDDSPTGPGDGGPYGANSVTYDVEYYENTIIYTGQQKEALLSVDTTGVYFTFDAAKLGNPPNSGSVIIIDGLYLRKVINVVSAGNTFIVETADAAITDAIKNGKISWDFTPSFSDVQSIDINNQKVKKDKPLGEPFEYEFELGNWKYTIWMNPNGTSPSGLPELQVNFIVENTEGAGGAVTSTLGAKGTTRIPHQNATIEIKNGQMTTFNNNNKGLRSELTLEYIAQFSAGGGQAIVEFPQLTMKIPISAFTSIPIPIPIYINVGISFNTIVNVPSVTASAMAKVKLILDSNTGFKFEGPSVSMNADVNGKDLGDFQEWLIGDMSISPAPVEMRYDLSCPRISVEVLGSEVAWAAATFSSRAVFMVPSL